MAAAGEQASTSMVGHAMNATSNPTMWGPPVLNKDGAVMGGLSVSTSRQCAWSPPGHVIPPTCEGSPIMKRKHVSRNMCVCTFHQGSRGSPRCTTATAAPSAPTDHMSNHPLLVPPSSQHMGHTCPEGRRCKGHGHHCCDWRTWFSCSPSVQLGLPGQDTGGTRRGKTSHL